MDRNVFIKYLNTFKDHWIINTLKPLRISYGAEAHNEGLGAPPKSYAFRRVMLMLSKHFLWSWTILEVNIYTFITFKQGPAV